MLDFYVKICFWLMVGGVVNSFLDIEKHGKPKSGEYKWYISLLSMCLTIPFLYWIFLQLWR